MVRLNFDKYDWMIMALFALMLALMLIVLFSGCSKDPEPSCWECKNNLVEWKICDKTEDEIIEFMSPFNSNVCKQDDMKCIIIEP